MDGTPYCDGYGNGVDVAADACSVRLEVPAALDAGIAGTNWCIVGVWVDPKELTGCGGTEPSYPGGILAEGPLASEAAANCLLLLLITEVCSDSSEAAIPFPERMIFFHFLCA